MGKLKLSTIENPHSVIKNSFKIADERIDRTEVN